MIAALLAITMLFDGESAAVIEPPTHPVPDQPSPEVLVVSTPVPTRPGGKHIATGVASWYGTGPGRGHAAAGPALRSALGSHWRGTVLTVWLDDHHVTVVVDDWCQCSWKKPGEKLIDLSDEDFGSLADRSRGIITVEVTR